MANATQQLEESLTTKMQDKYKTNLRILGHEIDVLFQVHNGLTV